MASWCKHYRGILGPGMQRIETCRVGIQYDSVKAHNGRHNVWSCMSKTEEERAETPTCEKAEYPTPEEEAAEYAEARRRLEAIFSEIKAGKCPHCHQPMTKQQIGRCVYAEPCGHRLYQGTLKNG